MRDRETAFARNRETASSVSLQRMEGAGPPPLGRLGLQLAIPRLASAIACSLHRRGARAVDSAFGSARRTGGGTRPPGSARPTAAQTPRARRRATTWGLPCLSASMSGVRPSVSRVPMPAPRPRRRAATAVQPREGAQCSGARHSSSTPPHRTFPPVGSRMPSPCRPRTASRLLVGTPVRPLTASRGDVGPSHRAPVVQVHAGNTTRHA